MARTTIEARLRRVARAATRRAAGALDGVPLLSNSALASRARLVEQRDKARAQVDTLRRQAETLREQRERGRYATHALSAFARNLDVDFDPAEGAAPLRQAIGQIRAEALIADGLLHGEDLDESLVASVRALLVTPRSIARARALCTVLVADERTRAAGMVALGHYLLVWGSRQRAHEQFSGAPVDLLVRTAALESVSTALHVDRPAGERLAAKLIEHPDLAPADAFAIAGVLAGAHLLPLSRRALDRADEANITDETLAKDIARLGHWLDTHPAELDTVAPARTRPALGVLHYDHPHYERSSSNLGDYTQTIAMLGHVLRRRGLTLHTGDAELQKSLETLRADIDPDLLRDAPAADIDIVPVTRDASRWEELPEPTWTVAFGWYMHPIFGVRTDMPFHRGVRPLFLSFHVNRTELLTPEAVAYLKKYGPVGCRDWTTVDLLLSHGVDAFFTGCLTTTTYLTGGRRGEGAPAGGSGTGRVDVLGDRSEDSLTQATTEVNDRTLAENLMAARDRHRVLRDSYESLHTSRLHVYLPATSMGVPVTFEPRNPADVRFEGLSGLTPDSPELADMQQRLTGLMDLVLDLITTGADEDTVYTAWRDHVAPLVAAARARRAHWQATHPPVQSLAGAATPVRQAAVHLAPGGTPAESGAEDGVVHVAIALDQNLIDAAPVVLQGIEENTTRQVRVHVLTRGVPAQTVQTWAATFDRLRFSHYRFDGIDYGPINRMLAHTTVSTMDRLLLPDVLAELPRVVYIDIDVTVLGEVGELFDLDLAGAPLAARPTASEWAESGLAFIYRAALRLDPEIAREFRAYMHARLEGDFTAFNAGILVLDLHRMRADGFTTHFAGMAGRYGLNDQDVLCCYAGTDAQPLDPRWNTFPTREPVPTDARLLHYAGGAKPWATLPLPAKTAWTTARDRWLARTHQAADTDAEARWSGNHVIDPDQFDGPHLPEDETSDRQNLSEPATAGARGPAGR